MARSFIVTPIQILLTFGVCSNFFLSDYKPVNKYFSQFSCALSITAKLIFPKPIVYVFWETRSCDQMLQKKKKRPILGHTIKQLIGGGGVGVKYKTK